MIDASSNKPYSIFNSINKMKVYSKVKGISVVFRKSLLAQAILGQDELRIKAFALNLDKINKLTEISSIIKYFNIKVFLYNKTLLI